MQWDNECLLPVFWNLFLSLYLQITLCRQSMVLCLLSMSSSADMLHIPGAFPLLICLIGFSVQPFPHLYLVGLPQVVAPPMFFFCVYWFVSVQELFKMFFPPSDIYFFSATVFPCSRFINLLSLLLLSLLTWVKSFLLSPRLSASSISCTVSSIYICRSCFILRFKLILIFLYSLTLTYCLCYFAHCAS